MFIIIFADTKYFNLLRTTNKYHSCTMNRLTKLLALICVCCLCQLYMQASTKGSLECGSIVSLTSDYEKVKELNKGDTVTIFMGREARNITVDWGDNTDCEFEIYVSCGLGSFVSVGTDKAKGPGKKTYGFTRVTVEDLKIVITKGVATIRNMQTLSTKADDNSSYNPI